MTILNNHDDEVLIKLEIDPKDPEYKRKTKDLSSPERIFNVKANLEDESVTNFIGFCRFIESKDEEAEKHIKLAQVKPEEPELKDADELQEEND